MASILILGVKVPFTSGGQDVLVRTLAQKLVERGHRVDTIELPFNVMPKENLLNQAALWRALDVTSFGGVDVDLVIATKFPSYYAKHPRKSLWMVHQHRPIYELYGGRYSDFSDDPRDEILRRMLVEGDRQCIGECAFVSGISKNVASRLENFLEVQAEALYPPLSLGNQYRSEGQDDYILSVGRLCAIKRVDMMIKALPSVHQFVKLKVVGTPDEPGIEDYFRNEIDKHHLWERVEFLGRVGDEELLSLYAHALAVYYAPHDEDYGYVTLEAMASSKPVIAATDSGGVLEFVQHEKNGLVVEPTIDAVSRGANQLIENKDLAKSLGEQGRRDIEATGLLDSGWDAVIDGLLSPLAADEARQSKRSA